VTNSLRKITLNNIVHTDGEVVKFIVRLFGVHVSACTPTIISYIVPPPLRAYVMIISGNHMKIDQDDFLSHLSQFISTFDVLHSEI